MGLWAIRLKKALFPPLTLLPSMESCLKKILPSIRRSLDPIKTNHDWPGKIPQTTKMNLTQMGSLRESCWTDTKEPWLWIPAKCNAYPVSFSLCTVRRNWHGDCVCRCNVPYLPLGALAGVATKRTLAVP